MDRWKFFLLTVGLLLLSWWLQTFLGLGTECIHSHAVVCAVCVCEHPASGSVHIIQSIMWHLCNGLIQLASDSIALQWRPAVRPQLANRVTNQVRICFFVPWRKEHDFSLNLFLLVSSLSSNLQQQGTSTIMYIWYPFLRNDRQQDELGLSYIMENCMREIKIIYYPLWGERSSEDNDWLLNFKRLNCTGTKCAASEML